MIEQEKNELLMFEKKLKEYVKEITETWRVDTPFHTTRYWTFNHKGMTYCVSRATRSFTQDTSYCFSQELGKTLYFGISKQDLLAHVAEVLRG